MTVYGGGGDAEAYWCIPEPHRRAGFTEWIILIAAVVDVRRAGQFVSTARIDTVTPSALQPGCQQLELIAES